MKKIILASMAALAVGLASTAHTPAFAGICPAGSVNPSATTIAECSIAPDNTTTDPMVVVRNIISTIVGLLGVVAVFVMIYGGILFMTAQGDAPKITRAKNTILYGLVGLVISLLAFAIVNFVIGKVTGSSGGGDDDDAMLVLPSDSDIA